MNYPMSISELMRRHVPIVALLVWVILSQLIPIPWSPRHSTDTDAAYHTILLLSEGERKSQSVAYEAVLLDSISAWQRKERLIAYIVPGYDSVSSRPYIAGDVVVGKMLINNGRGVMRQWESGVAEHLRGQDISLTSGKLTYYSIRCRQAIETLFERYINDKQALALIDALLLGDKRHLIAEQRYAFSDAGAMHVLAVSGLHVGVVRDVIIFILTLGGLLFIPWEKKRLRAAHRIVIIAGVWTYAFITGMSVSVMRSALMFSLMPIGRHQTDSPIKYNRLAAAAFIILFINPNALFSPSFLLSFSAVLAIMYYMPEWEKIITHHLSIGHRKTNTIYAHFTNILKDGILVSIAAQIGVLPWTLFFFGQVSNYFALTNLIVIPLTWLIVVISLSAAVTAALPVPEEIKSFMMSGSENLACLMNKYVHTIQHLPGATSFFTFDIELTVLLIIFIVMLSISTHYFLSNRKLALVAFLTSIVIGAAMIIHYSHILP